VGLVVVVVGGVQRGWMQKDRSNPGFELGIWVISSDFGGAKDLSQTPETAGLPQRLRWGV
jgi:hypothetical protein